MSAVTTSGGLTGAWRLVIQPSPEGAYLFVFETESSAVPERDYLQDSVKEAFTQAEEDFGAALRAWTPWEGPSLV
jgi:hypothetical protein